MAHSKLGYQKENGVLQLNVEDKTGSISIIKKNTQQLLCHEDINVGNKKGVVWGSKATTNTAITTSTHSKVEPLELDS